MAYALVTADFPGASSEKRKEIYECLKKENWLKVTEFGRDISTVWRASFQPGASDQRMKSTAINDFTKCSFPVVPKLVVITSEYEPAYHGLT